MTPERIKHLSQNIAAAILGNNDFITIPDRYGKPENIGYHELTEIIAREMSERLAFLESPLPEPIALEPSTPDPTPDVMDDEYDWQDPEHNPYLSTGPELSRAVAARLQGNS